MKEYTEHEMIEFALHFGLAMIDNRSKDESPPNASLEFENWKRKTGRK